VHGHDVQDQDDHIGTKWLTPAEEDAAKTAIWGKKADDVSS